MSKSVVLTGITTTGIPHLGNYIGAIHPAMAMTRNDDVNAYFFLADYHALIKCSTPQRLRESSLAVAATWLAMGLDGDNVVLYRQSDIPEITQLQWLLNCVCAKGLLNRAHAYKALVDSNLKENDDPDKGVTMGLFTYPVLMAADILICNADKVPVGKDQIQHIEMARDIAQRFNHIYGEHFVLPDAVVSAEASILPGLDGQKMSKTYDNTIPLFLNEKALRKKVMKIVTNSLEPGVPKDPDSSTVFNIYRAFAAKEAVIEMRQAFADGIAWGEAKQSLFECLNAVLEQPRERYNELIANPSRVEEKLQEGAEKVRAGTVPFMQQLKQAVGISQSVKFKSCI